jgi:hypothetical protein
MMLHNGYYWTNTKKALVLINCWSQNGHISARANSSLLKCVVFGRHTPVKQPIKISMKNAHTNYWKITRGVNSPWTTHPETKKHRSTTRLEHFKMVRACEILTSISLRCCYFKMLLYKTKKCYITEQNRITETSVITHIS